jgi:hypothetical protein
LLQRRHKHPETMMVALAVLTAWTVSLSIGYNSPALGSGALVAALLGLLLSEVANLRSVSLRRAAVVGCGLLAFLAVVEFVLGRERHVYGEPSAAHLSYSLGPLLAGGDGIKTDVNTAAYLGDLQRIEHNVGQPYAILPGCPACWIKSSVRDPLPIDWAQSPELSNASLVEKVTDALALQRGHVSVIVERVQPEQLSTGFDPLAGDYPVVRYVRRFFHLWKRDRLFDIYR